MVVCPSCGQENPDGFRFCGGCAGLLVPEAPERRKLATLLFCDLSGSTAMGERLDAESVRELMSRYFAEMRESIERHGGTVEKFIGDAVVGVFGVPVAHEDDALRAVRAASEMRTRLAMLNEEFEKRFANRLSLRIGVNTGQVVAGDASTRQMIVTGDTVNVAARLEQSAQPGEILAGASTYDLVRHAVAAEAVPPLAVKGKSEPVAAYRVVGVRSVGRPQAQAFDAPMIGRARELALLEGAFEEVAAERTCKLVTVVGEPGIGKSRLATEFVSRLAGTVAVLRGRCPPYGEGITFWAVAELVRQAAGVSDGDSRDEAEARVRSLLGDDTDADLLTERVGQAIGLTAGVASAAEIAWAIRRLFQVLARSGPLVLVIDDIQWAEGALLDLLVAMSRLTTGAPILVLCLARPDLLEERPAWGPAIRLAPLGGSDEAELIDDLLGGKALAPRIREQMLRAASGNPLFVEELIRALTGEDPSGHGGSVFPTGPDQATIEIPTTLGVLLGARLDRLSEPERAAIERGAIEGELFHQGAVLELTTPERRSQVPSDLAGLVRKELVRPAASAHTGETAFQFSHILVRDAAYNAMAKKLRSELHEAFAGWLERTAGDRLSEYEEICGYHLEQASRYAVELGQIGPGTRALSARAAERLSAAGGRAFARGDMAGAGNLLGRACGLLPEEEPNRPALLLMLGSAVARIGELGKADEAFADAAATAVAASDERLEILARVERSSWRLWSDPWSRETARPVAERAIGSFEDRHDDAGLAKAWHLLADIESQWLANTEALERALVHARRGGDRREEADILWWLTVSLYFGPTPAADGIRRCEQILEDATGERTVQAGTLGILAGLHAMRGDFDEARALFRRGLVILEELGVSLRVASRRTVSGAIELLADDPVAAERELRLGFESLQEMGEHQDLPGIAAQLAEALYRQGRYEEAEQFTTISEAEEHARMRWRGPRAKLLARAGDPDGAEAAARAAVSTALGFDNSNVYANALMDLAEVLQLAGRGRSAVPHLETAAAVYEQKGNLVGAAKAREALQAPRAAPSTEGIAE